MKLLFQNREYDVPQERIDSFLQAHTTERMIQHLITGKLDNRESFIQTVMQQKAPNLFSTFLKDENRLAVILAWHFSQFRDRKISKLVQQYYDQHKKTLSFALEENVKQERYFFTAYSAIDALLPENRQRVKWAYVAYRLLISKNETYTMPLLLAYADCFRDIYYLDGLDARRQQLMDTFTSWLHLDDKEYSEDMAISYHCAVQSIDQLINQLRQFSPFDETGRIQLEEQWYEYLTVSATKREEYILSFLLAFVSARYKQPSFFQPSKHFYPLYVSHFFCYLSRYYRGVTNLNDYEVEQVLMQSEPTLSSKEQEVIRRLTEQFCAEENTKQAREYIYQEVKNYIQTYGVLQVVREKIYEESLRVRLENASNAFRMLGRDIVHCLNLLECERIQELTESAYQTKLIAIKNSYQESVRAYEQALKEEQEKYVSQESLQQKIRNLQHLLQEHIKQKEALKEQLVLFSLVETQKELQDAKTMQEELVTKEDTIDEQERERLLHTLTIGIIGGHETTQRMVKEKYPKTKIAKNVRQLDKLKGCDIVLALDFSSHKDTMPVKDACKANHIPFEFTDIHNLERLEVYVAERYLLYTE